MIRIFRRFSFVLIALTLLASKCNKEDTTIPSTLSYEKDALKQSVLIGGTLDLTTFVKNIPSGTTLSFRLKTVVPGVTVGTKTGVVKVSIREGSPSTVTILISHPEIGGYRAGEIAVNVEVKKIPFSVKMKDLVGSTDLLLIPSGSTPASLDVSSLAEGIFGNETYSIKDSKRTGATIVPASGALTVDESVAPGDLKVVIRRVGSSAYISGSAEVTVKIKHPFSLRLKGKNTNIPIVKPIKITEIKTLKIPDYLEGITKDSKLTYKLRGTVTGVNIVPSTGVVSIQGTVVLGDYVVEVSQADTDTHVAGTYNVTVKVSNFSLKRSTFKKKATTFSVTKDDLSGLDLSTTYEDLPKGATVTYAIGAANGVGLSGSRLIVSKGSTATTDEATLSHDRTTEYKEGTITFVVAVIKPVIPKAVYAQSYVRKSNSKLLLVGFDRPVNIAGTSSDLKSAFNVNSGSGSNGVVSVVVKNAPSTQVEVTLTIEVKKGESIQVKYLKPTLADNKHLTTSGAPLNVAMVEGFTEVAANLIGIAEVFVYADAGLTNGKFVEATADDGGLKSGQKITVHLTEGEFLKSITKDSPFTAGPHYTATDVPAGLAMVVTKKSATTAEITFTGKATNHANTNDVSDVTLVWKSAAVQGAPDLSAVSTKTKADVSIDFADPSGGGAKPSFAYAGAGLTGGKFVEASANDGGLKAGQKVTATVSNGTFLSSIANNNPFTATHYTATKVPAGLAMVVTKKSATTAEITFTGKATNHANTNDVSDVTLVWKSAAVQGAPDLSAVSTKTKADVSIDFADPSGGGAKPSFTYDDAALTGGKFVEALANDGSIKTSQNIAVTISGANFNHAISAGTDLTQGTHYTVANVPPGLTVKVTVQHWTGVDIYLTGKATNHANANDVSDVTLVWKSAALESSPSLSGVSTASKSDIKIDFYNSMKLSYSEVALFGQRYFDEDVHKPGQLEGGRKVTITLQNGEFLSSIKNGAVFTTSTHYAVLGMPAGLSLVLTKRSATTAEITLTGTATDHANGNSTSFTFRMAQAAFEGPLTFGVGGTSPTNVPPFYVGNILFTNPNPYVSFATYDASSGSLIISGDHFPAISFANPLTVLTSIAAEYDFSKITIQGIGAKLALSALIGATTVDFTSSYIKAGEINIVFQGASKTKLDAALRNNGGRYIFGVGVAYNLEVETGAFVKSSSITDGINAIYTTGQSIAGVYEDLSNKVITPPVSLTVQETVSNNGSFSSNPIAFVEFSGVTIDKQTDALLSSGLGNLTEGKHYTVTGNVPAGLRIFMNVAAETITIHGTHHSAATVTGGHTSAENTTVTVTFLPALFDKAPSLSAATGTSFKIAYTFRD